MLKDLYMLERSTFACVCLAFASKQLLHTWASTTFKGILLYSGPPGPSSLANNAQDAQQKLVAALAKAAIGQVRRSYAA